MRFGGSGLVALELDSNRLRLVHGSASAASVRIHNFAVEELLTPNAENVAQQIGLLLRRTGVRASGAAFVLSGPEVVHRVLEFPPMPLRELDRVVGREIRLLGEIAGKEVVFDWEVIEESQGGNLEKLRVLVAIAPRSQVDATVELLGSCRLKPALLTTAPLSLLRSLKYARAESSALRAVLYLGQEQGCLLGLRHGAWGFLREFSSRTGAAGSAGLLDEAAREAGRAAMYFGQRHGEENTIGFLLGGAHGLDALEARLKQELGANAAIARPGRGVDLTPLKARAATFRKSFPAFLICLGLIAASAHAGINLAPKAARRVMIRRPQLDFSVFQRPIWLAVAFLLVVGAQWYLGSSEATYRKLLEERVALYAQWIPAAQGAQESRELYENQKLLERALGAGRGVEISWVPLFKWLSRAVPPDLVLEAMSLSADQGKWQARVSGEVVAPDLYSAQAAFNRFYEAFKDSPRVSGVELSPLRVSNVTEALPVAAATVQTRAREEEPERGEAARREIKKTKVAFELRAHWSESHNGLVVDRR